MALATYLAVMMLARHTMIGSINPYMVELLVHIISPFNLLGQGHRYMFYPLYGAMFG
jgi:hypothetical protein